jgi:uncharacterized protein (DUF1330 family)
MRYTARGGDPSVLLEFYSPERAIEWYNSPQCQTALKVRLRSAKTKVVMLTGYSEA